MNVPVALVGDWIQTTTQDEIEIIAFSHQFKSILDILTDELDTFLKQRIDNPLEDRSWEGSPLVL